jgi:hypothetical protein
VFLTEETNNGTPKSAGSDRIYNSAFRIFNFKQIAAWRPSNLPDNSPPLAAPDNYPSVHGCRFMTPMDNDSDPDGDPLAIAVLPSYRLTDN